MKSILLTTLSAGALLASTGAAQAQTQQQQGRDQEVLGAILGALFGDRFGGAGTLDAQWAAGRRPLYDQRAQFEARIDTDVRAGRMSSASGQRLKADYAALVEVETRYGADRRFTTQERADLNARYQALTQTLDQGGYSDAAAVADGRAEFEARVDAQVRARRLSRTEGTRLKSDYAALIQVEAGYLNDGRLSTREREDLDARLDALDARVGDVNYGGGGASQTPRARLDAVLRALPNSGLSTSAQAQVRVEQEDLLRLEAAYGRFTPTADDRSYLERRIADLETRVRIRR